MGLKLWTPGELVTSTDLNALSKQSVIVCTSGARPSSPIEGMTLFETDTDRYKAWTGTKWATVAQVAPGTYTPVVTASTTNPTLGSGATAVAEYYFHNGDECTVRGNVTFGSTMTAGSGQYFISLPPGVTVASTGILLTGTAMLRDNSAGSVVPAVSYVGGGATTLSITSTSGIVGSGTPWAWAASDYMQWQMTFRMA